MRHERWIAPLLPYGVHSEEKPVEHHLVTQAVGDRLAQFKYIMSLEAADDRKAQAFMLLGARRDLRAFIAESSKEELNETFSDH
jgi:hypothetical protein